MTLKLFMMYSYGVTMQLVSNPNWEWMSKSSNPTIYFHPDEEGHAFVGDKLLKNYNIKFLPFNDPVELPDDTTVFFLVRHEPEGMCDLKNNTRWAFPAKGTRVDEDKHCPLSS